MADKHDDQNSANMNQNTEVNKPITDLQEFESKSKFAIDVEGGKIENESDEKSEYFTTPILMLTALCMGLLFGAAMERGKVTPPITIRKQFLFRRFIMIKMFLTASSFGAICFAVLSIFFPASFEPVRGKFMSSRAAKGLVPVVIGTFLLGCGMTIAGACPGMVYIQLGAGIENAIITLIGGMAAAMVYGLVQPFITSFLAVGCTEKHKVDDFSMLKGFKYWHFVPVLVAFMVIATALFEHYFPWDSPSELGAIGDAAYTPWSQAWPPELSGVLIGSLQLPAVLVAHGTVGSSSTYMTLMAQLLVTPSLRDRFKHMDGFRTGAGMWHSVVYIWSAALGAYIAAQAGGTFKSSRGVPPGPAFIGGFLMLFGSRCAGPPPAAAPRRAVFAALPTLTAPLLSASIVSILLPRSGGADSRVAAGWRGGARAGTGCRGWRCCRCSPCWASPPCSPAASPPPSSTTPSTPPPSSSSSDRRRPPPRVARRRNQSDLDGRQGGWCEWGLL